MSGLDEDILKKPQNSPLDAFHVKQVNILYNLEADKCFCLLETNQRGCWETSWENWHQMWVDYWGKDNRL